MDSTQLRQVEPPVIPDLVICTCCHEKLDDEQASAPRRDTDGDIMCDDCYRDEYETQCERCMNIVEKTEMGANPGEIIAVWQKSPARFGVGDLEPGYYRVKQWPIYADGMIEGYMFADHLEKVCELDSEGLLSVEQGATAMCGALCQSCRDQVEALLG